MYWRWGFCCAALFSTWPIYWTAPACAPGGGRLGLGSTWVSSFCRRSSTFKRTAPRQAGAQTYLGTDKCGVGNPLLPVVAVVDRPIAPFAMGRDEVFDGPLAHGLGVGRVNAIEGALVD